MNKVIVKKFTVDDIDLKRLTDQEAMLVRFSTLEKHNVTVIFEVPEKEITLTETKFDDLIQTINIQTTDSACVAFVQKLKTLMFGR